MRKTGETSISIALGALAAFALWTVAITRIDVQPIGPNGTAVRDPAAKQGNRRPRR